MLNERLLQFIWQFQYFNKGNLQSTNNDAITVIKQGIVNTNEGPDFLQAIIKVNNVVLHGSVEIHILSSQWNTHKHNHNKHYSNVVLHVVWENDVKVNDIPTIELQGRVSTMAFNKYIHFMQGTAIPCQSIEKPTLPDIVLAAWKERLVVERLQRKIVGIQTLLAQTNYHWEEVFWWKLAANFGSKVNADCFEAIAKSIPVTVLAKHKNQLIQLEALLLGQANLLSIYTTDVYVLQLQKEYSFLKKKFQLQPMVVTPKFLRMRPANFPTIRLAQLAQLIHKSKHLFALVKEAENIKTIQALLQLEASAFFNTHYTLETETSSSTVKVLGADTINNIIINTIIPVIFAYAQMHNDTFLKEKLITWLQQLPAENNTITTQWKKMGYTNKSAFDSQAFIELTNNYCYPKKCLQCAVGNYLLKKEFSG